MGDRWLIELQGLGRSYPSDPPVQALVDANLCVGRGESLAIVGPSGSGKSTLLNVLGCLDRPTSGKYLFDGVDVGSLRDGELAALRSRYIGFIFQSFHLLSHRSVIENVMLAEVYRRTPHAGRQERASMVLKRVGLGHRLEFLPTRLSGGERQRVAIARALLGSPSIMLCDEPTGNLDSKTSGQVLALLDELRDEGLTVIIITHDHEVANHAKRMARIVDGKLSEVERSELTL